MMQLAIYNDNTYQPLPTYYPPDTKRFAPIDAPKPPEGAVWPEKRFIYLMYLIAIKILTWCGVSIVEEGEQCLPPVDCSTTYFDTSDISEYIYKVIEQHPDILYRGVLLCSYDTFDALRDITRNTFAFESETKFSLQHDGLYIHGHYKIPIVIARHFPKGTVLPITEDVLNEMGVNSKSNNLDKLYVDYKYQNLRNIDAPKKALLDNLLNEFNQGRA